MKRFEYCAFALKEVSSADNLPKVLMEGRKDKFPGLETLGEDGWELVAALTYDRFHRLIFKREVTGAKTLFPTKAKTEETPEKAETSDEGKSGIRKFLDL